jgi:hypothetical protein
MSDSASLEFTLTSGSEPGVTAMAATRAETPGTPPPEEEEIENCQSSSSEGTYNRTLLHTHHTHTRL